MAKRRKQSRSSSATRRPSAKVQKQDMGDAMVLFSFLALLVVIVFFFGEIETGEFRQETEDPEIARDVLLSKLVIDHPRQNGPAIIVGNVVDTSMLQKLASADYRQLKKTLGVEAEFVIYFEDNEGNLVQVTDKPCIGSGYAKVNGHKCDE